MPRVLFIVLLIAFLLTHCSSGRKAEPSTEERSSIAETGRVIADAYLFDCKLRRDGKPNSFRLELFVADSTAAFSGKGYLGKGIFHGLLTRDSIYIVFPTKKEYLVEAVTTLLRSGDCVPEISDSNILQYLQPLTSAMVGDATKKSYTRTIEESGDDCSLSLNFKYKKRNKLWYPDQILYEDNKNTRLTAKCREVKVGAKIAANRFQFTPPEQAVRIFP